MSLTLRTAFCRDQHHTVSTAHTKYSCGRCILQNGDTLDFVGVDIPHLTLDTVHLDQWRGVGPRSLSTDEDLGSVGTRLT